MIFEVERHVDGEGRRPAAAEAQDGSEEKAFHYWMYPSARNVRSCSGVSTVPSPE